nr:retrovirus-related Pol polyprotein from transposon TNT 1-94 [Tanacetum cinerariifolium]
MLLEGSELTKEDRESQLYDDFEHFRQQKGESIHDYYVRFSKLINDIRIIKMTMSRMQLNFKFVNNMLPEWGRFVTAVKLNRGLRDSNYDQLYAYLKQHETHVKENKMMLERFSQNTVDPLALMFNVSNPQRYSPSSSTSSSTQLLFLAGGQDNAFDDDVDEQPVQDLALNVDNVFQSDDCNAFDSDVDEAPTAQTMFMANLSSTYPVTDEVGPSYDSDILSEVHDHDNYQDAACAHHEEHVMHDSVQLDHVVDSHADYTSDSNMIPYDQYVKDNEPALYNGHEIIKDNHTPPIVHNTKDTLEIAEITWKKMNAKMNDPECVTRKVKIAPHDYSKENFLATFTPQKQLTPKQIFWKHDAVEWKNLLNANDNLIAECLSKEVFSVATNSELNVARFTKMTVAHTDVEARCLELEAELAKLRNMSHHDNQEELINRFSKLETADSQITKLTEQVTNLQAQNNLFRAENGKIKQRCKELYDFIKITRAKHIEQVTSLTTKNVNLKAQTLEKVNSVSKDQVKPKVLAQEKHAIDVEPIVPRLRNNRDASVETIRDIIEEAKVALNNELNNLLTFLSLGRSKLLLQNHLIRVNSCPNANGSQPKSNVKPNRISSAKGVNKLPVEDQPRTIMFQLRTSNRVDSSSLLKRTNRTFVEAPRTMLIFSKSLMFLWAEAVATAVLGALCYPTNDSKDLGKLQPTPDARIFVGYAPSRKGYRIYNKKTRQIMETIHVQFDELTEPMAPMHLGTGPTPNFLTPGQISSGLVPNPVPATPYAPPPIKNWRFYFSQCLMTIWNLLAERPVPPAQAVQALVNSTAEPNYMEDHTVSLIDNNPFVNVFALEPHSEASSSGDMSLTESPYVSQTLHHLNK